MTALHLRFLASVTVVASLVFGIAVAIPAQDTFDPGVVHWETADWGPPTHRPGFPPGLRNAPVATDPQTGGPTYFARFPAGSAFAMHWHTHTETLVVLEGTVDVTLDGKLYTAETGSYIIIPATVPHSYTVPEDADVVLLARRDGPADFFFLED